MLGKSVKESLLSKMKVPQKKIKNLRKPLNEDVFEIRKYIGPSDLYFENYLRHTPNVAFNPAAFIEDDKLTIFPRVIFDYKDGGYTSSIGHMQLKIDEVIEEDIKKPISARIIMWPRSLLEFRGCEDPRVQVLNKKLYMLYTGYGFVLKEGKLAVSILQCLAELHKDMSVERLSFFKIKGNNDLFTPYMKDSAFIKPSGKTTTVLLRPSISEEDICWNGIIDMGDLTIDEKTMEPVLANEKWEFKVGWSTNTLKISNNEYLVGWHSVILKDYSYRDGLAIVDAEGNLLAISNYLLAPQGLIEEYGDRALTIFGCGLVRYKEKLVWVGGVGDTFIGIFATNFDKALEKLTWIKC